MKQAYLFSDLKLLSTVTESSFIEMDSIELYELANAVPKVASHELICSIAGSTSSKLVGRNISTELLYIVS